MFGSIQMKNYLVTGSGRGIGFGIASKLAQSANQVCFNCRTASTYDKLRMKLSNFKYCNVIVADVNKINQVDYLVKTIPYKLDGIVLSVGTTVREGFLGFNRDAWEEVLSVNLTNQVELLHKLLPKCEKGASVLFIGSVLGNKADSKSLSYGVSKGTLPILVKYLAKELSPNITVNCIAPGFVDTDWHKSKTPQDIKNIVEKIPLVRFAEVSEIASLAVELLNNGYITGQTMYIDGGYSL